MHALVTGAAGFIGSHLCEALVARGWTVRGLDALTPYYPANTKLANLTRLLEEPSFEFVCGDLGEIDLPPVLDGCEVVFHQAAQPGVRQSWSEGFEQYERHNVFATHRLLEAVRKHPLRRLVYASSSSVYGNQDSPVLSEDSPTVPHSPYGVTKLAGELLCRAYAANFGIPTVSLRYFTVYGPRQRPDMAFHRAIRAALDGTSFPLFGDGTQIRDFTYVGDVVAANIAVAEGDIDPGSFYNVAGGSAVSMREVLQVIAGQVGGDLHLDAQLASAGDVQRTCGSTAAIQKDVAWRAQTDLAVGIASQVGWLRAKR